MIVKRLLLIRHAKSSWKNSSLHDHDRPLNKRGERDVLSMAEHLVARNEMPEAIYSSTAERALSYARYISERADIPLHQLRSLYTFDDQALMRSLRDLPATLSRVAVVGHNPAITVVANRLSGEAIDNVPTSAVVALDCQVEHWAALVDGSGSLAYFDYPKMFR